MCNRPRRRIKAHQLGQLAIKTEIARCRTAAQHEWLVGQVVFHGGQKPPIAGIDDRRCDVIGAHHIQTTHLAIGEILLELLVRCLR